MKLRNLQIGGLRFAAMLFIAAIPLRFSSEAAHSWALAAQESPASSITAAECSFSTEQISAQLDIRAQALQAGEIILGEREKAISRLEQSVEIQKRDLDSQERKLRELYAITSEAAEKDLAKLVDIYEAMKPKEAAALFAHMDPKFAAGFLGKMKANEAALVLSHISPDLAYNISAILASRNLGHIPDPGTGAH